MKVEVNTCYTHILYMLCAGPIFGDAVSSFAIKEGPHYQYEGVAGYIETVVTFEVKDLRKFTDLWLSWYSLTDKKRLDLYGLAKGLGDCK